MKLTKASNIYPLTHLIGHSGRSLWVQNLANGVRRFFVIRSGIPSKPWEDGRFGFRFGTELREPTIAELRLALARLREQGNMRYERGPLKGKRWCMAGGSLGIALASACDETPFQSGVSL